MRHIAEAFVESGGRMKTVAAMLGARNLRTRQGAAWSDVSVARALLVICDNGLVDPALRDRCRALLADRSAAAKIRRPAHPLGAVVHCACAGRFYCMGTGASARFVCRSCRTRIPARALEAAFESSLASVTVSPGEMADAFSDRPEAAEVSRLVGSEPVALSVIWPALKDDERRQLVDVAVARITVDGGTITVRFATKPDSSPDSAAGTQDTLPCSSGFTAPAVTATREGNTGSMAGHDQRSRPRARVAAPDGRRNLPRSAESVAEFVTVGDVAVLLRTSRKAVYTMLARGQLRGAVRIGRRLRFRREELLDSIAGSRAPSPKETRR